MMSAARPCISGQVGTGDDAMVIRIEHPEAPVSSSLEFGERHRTIEIGIRRRNRFGNVEEAVARGAHSQRIIVRVRRSGAARRFAVPATAAAPVTTAAHTAAAAAAAHSAAVTTTAAAAMTTATAA